MDSPIPGLLFFWLTYVIGGGIVVLAGMALARAE